MRRSWIWEEGERTQAHGREGDWLVGGIERRPVWLECSEKERGSEKGEKGEGGKEDGNHAWSHRPRGGA